MPTVPIFAEEKYQLAFDRGVEEAKSSFAKLRETTSYSPRECPLDRAELTLAISDLLTAETTETARRLMIALAVGGAKMQWAVLSGSAMRKSGVVRVGDLGESRSPRRGESGG